ncbi:hypothetical protein GDO81_000031 [Engystomops pustulosus]|uniref:Uncharacterized protein n=1 Tax=Engystomops pustulosus TaxID=76066 RepID=A0AAV7D4X9_ENGPU|nr:hypothetical protein GDO81_000031 [Engystomops pustulosus]
MYLRVFFIAVDSRRGVCSVYIIQQKITVPAVVISFSCVLSPLLMQSMDCASLGQMILWPNPKSLLTGRHWSCSRASFPTLIPICVLWAQIMMMNVVQHRGESSTT